LSLKNIAIAGGLVTIVIAAALLYREQRHMARGAELAALYCSSCHVEPAPQILPKASWEAALAYMGYWLGIENIDFLDDAPEFVRSNVASRLQVFEREDVFPAAPVLNDEDWETLRDYYVGSAPAVALPQLDKPKLRWQMPRFRASPSSYRRRVAVTTMVHIREETGEIYIGDSLAATLTVLNADGQLTATRQFRPRISPVDIEFLGDTAYLGSIGDLTAQQAASARPAHVAALSLVDQSIANATSRVVLQDLFRMADLELADLDEDGRPDLIISGFGSITGNVSWFPSMPGGVYDDEEQVLLPLPGAVKSVAHDFDSDGRLDIMTLVSDAREGLHILLNRGGREFEQRTVFETHSAYGHTYFELQDFNGDGLMDVLAVNGDNVDSDPYNTPKNYHGIRIYLNRGELKFEEAAFYPMYGAFIAKAADFDGDGDLDIAAISFYPDYSAPRREAFVYLENQGDLSFVPQTNEEVMQGRWMTMDVGDIDGDDDVDVVLGGAYLAVGMLGYPELLEEMTVNGDSVLILKNTLN